MTDPAPFRSPRRRALRAVALLLATATALAACSQAEPETRSAPKAPSGDPLDLAGVCPDPVVIQADWAPEAEHGAQYQLLGEGYEIDGNAKKVTGPLVASGKDTGVDVEIRAGGAATGFEPVAGLMYTDPDITLGFVNTDDAVGLSSTQKVVGVVTPLDINPQIIMWDPKTHPEFQTISDIGQTDTTVLYAKIGKYMEYLIGSGILKRSQVDASYDGSPSRFVSSKGDIAQQGYATDEPYYYEELLAQWKRPVAFQLVHETGYPVYPSALSVRSDRLEELSPCLEKLVPIIQQAQVDYSRNPEPVNELIVEAAEEYKIGWDYTLPRSAFSIKQQLELGIVGNGDNETLGDFDTERLQRVIDIVGPIFASQGTDVDKNLEPTDIATNEFIDESISLSQ